MIKEQQEHLKALNLDLMKCQEKLSNEMWAAYRGISNTNADQVKRWDAIALMGDLAKTLKKLSSITTELSELTKDQSL